MAEQTQGSIRIDADRGAILAEIADFESYPEWTNGVNAVDVLERDAEGRGTQVRFELSAGPMNARYTLAYQYDGDGVSWTLVEGSPIRAMDGEYRLVADGDGTEVTYRLRLDPGIPMLGFMKRQAERQIIDTALKGLKKRVEGRA